MTCDKCNNESCYVLDTKDIVTDKNLFPIYCPVCDDVRLYNIELHAYVLTDLGQATNLKLSNADLIAKIRSRKRTYKILGDQRDEKSKTKDDKHE